MNTLTSFDALTLETDTFYTASLTCTFTVPTRLINAVTDIYRTAHAILWFTAAKSARLARIAITSGRTARHSTETHILPTLAILHAFLFPSDVSLAADEMEREDLEALAVSRPVLNAVNPLTVHLCPSLGQPVIIATDTGVKHNRPLKARKPRTSKKATA